MTYFRKPVSASPTPIKDLAGWISNFSSRLCSANGLLRCICKYITKPQWGWRVLPARIQEFKWLSWMFKSSWSSLSPLERFVSTLVTRISQSPCYVTQLSVIDSSRSLYISSALLGRILKITFGIRLSCPSLPCCEGNELKEVVSCAEGLLWADLAPRGRTNLKALSGSFT